MGEETASFFSTTTSYPALRAASFFASNLGWTVEEVSARDDLHQWAVLRTSVDPDTRPFDHFVDF
ncbi:MAG: hypothetical protein M3317_04450 [Actinomycetota bacterium]|nr:hypothetical protein [Actinomycetota bacterium]